MSARRLTDPALTGLAAVVFGVGAGELAAGLALPAASPVLAVGGLLIDLAPPWAKDAAIALFGTADKIALLVGIVVVVALLAGSAGVLAARSRILGVLVVCAVGALGVTAALTRPGAVALTAVPALLATVAAAVALALLAPRRPDPSLQQTPMTRRTFLGWAAGAGALGVVAAVGGAVLQGGTRAVSAIRSSLILPRAVVTADAIPASAEFAIDALTGLITPNAEFYRIDTALRVPELDPANWSLRIHGLVQRELLLTWDDVLALPLEESTTTLMCVSNPVGGDLIGTATWLGYPIRLLLERAGVDPNADMVLSRSSDGFTAGTPLQALTDDRNAILAVGMNGVPLPLEHGFPARLVVPGLYGYVSATKWVTELKVTRFDADEGYWIPRGWSERGPIKVGSRIDVPRRGSVPSGKVVVAGVAWHPHTGIDRVEVRVDDGAWASAELATAVGADTWVQWRYDWDAAPGPHALQVRATSADGEVQTAVNAPPAPDGATGHHTVRLTVTSSS